MRLITITACLAAAFLGVLAAQFFLWLLFIKLVIEALHWLGWL